MYHRVVGLKFAYASEVCSAAIFRVEVQVKRASSFLLHFSSNFRRRRQYVLSNVGKPQPDILDVILQKPAIFNRGLNFHTQRFYWLEFCNIYFSERLFFSVNVVTLFIGVRLFKKQNPFVPFDNQWLTCWVRAICHSSHVHTECNSDTSHTRTGCCMLSFLYTVTNIRVPRKLLAIWAHTNSQRDALHSRLHYLVSYILGVLTDTSTMMLSSITCD
jgi:hypothetical protein